MIGDGGEAGNPYYYQYQPNQNHHQQQQQFHQFHHGRDLDAMDGGAGGFVPDPPQITPPPGSAADAQCHALLYNLSVLRDKVHQLQPLVGLALAHDDDVPMPTTTSGGGGGPITAAAAAVIQDIIAAASSMMYAFQHLSGQTQPQGGSSSVVQQQQQQAAVIDHHVVQQQWQHHDQHQHQHGGGYGRHIHDSKTTMTTPVAAPSAASMPSTSTSSHPNPTTTTTAVTTGEEDTVAGTIIELEAAELLAKYTHYCHVCGKGFKRDANLRMHMRAHGDEYKSSAALANPSTKHAATSTTTTTSLRSLYSCPQEGCRWNRKHAKFQPLKSVVCAKNHYKRSHCPKMYVCNRCGRKHFSVLSDLRTHEKHCGDHHRWLCSCGTSFSRKDKLVGHLALFAGDGHQPAVPLDNANGGRSRRSSAALSTSTPQLGT